MRAQPDHADVRAEPDHADVRAEPDHADVRAEPDHADVRAEPDHADVQAEPDHADVQAEPDHADVQAEPDHADVQAEPDHADGRALGEVPIAEERNDYGLGMSRPPESPGPWIATAVALVIGAIAVDSSTGESTIALGIAALGGLIGQVAAIAYGVEWGMRRYDWRKRR